MSQKNEQWDITIQANGSKSSIEFSELLKYKDLLFLFIKRDFIASFKQTILGPTWFVIKPLFQSITMFVVFGKVANFQPEGVDGMSFYLGGILLWVFFTGTLLSVSDTFISNARIFGKVYFPRLITPFSKVMSEGLKLTVQFLLFLAIFLWAYFINGNGDPNWFIFIIPLLIIHTALLSLGLGLIISSLTTKYRDLKFLLTFGIQLVLYCSTVPYPLEMIRRQSALFGTVVSLNPMSSIIEIFRYAFMGGNAGEVNWYLYLYSVAFTLVVLVLGINIFNRVEKNFMDTV